MYSMHSNPKVKTCLFSCPPHQPASIPSIHQWWPPDDDDGLFLSLTNYTQRHRVQETSFILLSKLTKLCAIFACTLINRGRLQNPVPVALRQREEFLRTNYNDKE